MPSQISERHTMKKEDNAQAMALDGNRRDSQHEMLVIKGIMGLEAKWNGPFQLPVHGLDLVAKIFDLVSVKANETVIMYRLCSLTAGHEWMLCRKADGIAVDKEHKGSFEAARKV
jgi:hypothetical protein